MSGTLDTITFGAVLILAAQAMTLATAVIGVWASRRNAAKIAEVHLMINSRMDDLLKLTEQSAHAAGMKDEKERSE